MLRSSIMKLLVLVVTVVLFCRYGIYQNALQAPWGSSHGSESPLNGDLRSQVYTRVIHYISLLIDSLLIEWDDTPASFFHVIAGCDRTRNPPSSWSLEAQRLNMLENCCVVATCWLLSSWLFLVVPGSCVHGHDAFSVAWSEELCVWHPPQSWPYFHHWDCHLAWKERLRLDAPELTGQSLADTTQEDYNLTRAASMLPGIRPLVAGQRWFLNLFESLWITWRNWMRWIYCVYIYMRVCE